MNYEIDDNGYVMLPGSEEWRGAYEDGRRLDMLFPGNSAHDFMYCLEYNDDGPIKPGVKIADLKCLNEGENDGDNWIWRVALSNGQVWMMEGWCDYTGWDCQSGNTWSEWPQVALHCKTCTCNG